MKRTHPQLTTLETGVWEFCRAYAKRPAIGQRLVVYGNNGCGKSHAARAIIAWARAVALMLPTVCDEANMALATAHYVHWPSLLKLLKSGHWDALEEYFNVSLLALDDVGAEHDPSAFGVSELYLLMERRAKRWTIITTNVKPEAWDGNFERRIASRMLRNTRLVALDKVPDYGSI